MSVTPCYDEIVLLYAIEPQLDRATRDIPPETSTYFILAVVPTVVVTS